MNTDDVLLAVKRLCGALCLVLAAGLLAGCVGAAKLPPPAGLESGCHVWFVWDVDAGTGVSSEVHADGTSTVRLRRTSEGARLAGGGKILWDDEVIAKIDGSRVLLGYGDPFEVELFADLLPPSPVLLVRDQETGKPWREFRRSAGCTAEQSAVGVAPLNRIIVREVSSSMR